MRTLPTQPREAAMTSPSPKRIKRLIAAGHRPPRGVHPRNPRPCAGGNHRGPLVNTTKYRSHPEPFWHDFGECAACRSTITSADIRRRAS